MTDEGLEGVRRALTQVTTDHSSKDLLVLDAAVRQFTNEMQSVGASPEIVLARLVAVLIDPAIGPVSDWWRSVLRDRCVRQAIEAYYAIDLSKPTPPRST